MERRNISKLSTIEDRGLTACISNLDLRPNFQLQSHESYGHNQYTCKKVKVKGHSVQKLSGHRQMDGGDCIISHANMVSNNVERTEGKIVSYFCQQFAI